jgi:hypothetical protein
MSKTTEATRSSTTASRSSSPFFDKSNGTAEAAHSFFTHSTGIQTKLAIGKADDEFEQEADRVADRVQTKLSVGAPDDPYEAEADQMADKVINQAQNVPSVQSKKEPSQRARECEEGDYVFLKPAGIQRLGEDIDSNGSRESIVAAARSMIGKIEAKHAEGTQRVGAKHLLDIFHLAAPGVWDDATVQTAGSKLPSWCGIFSVWAHKRAGKDIGNWQIGRGVSAFGTIQQTKNPQAGDIGYIDQPFQHHCIIVKVDGNNVISIDGNSGLYSEVKENTRPLSVYTGFFTAFGAGSSVQRKSKVQKKGNGEAATAPSSVEQTLSATRGKGDPLPGKLQQSMGTAMGSDFSNVRVHSDQVAADMSNALNAQAFTHGNDIYFNKGKYDPLSRDGQHLLAHELTHTVQQGSALKRKDILQRTGETATTQAEINETEFNNHPSNEKKGSIKKSGKQFTIRAINMSIKGYADKALVDASKPFKKPKEERNTKQAEAWRGQIIDSIKKCLEAALPDPSLKNNGLLVLELKSNPAVKVVGSFNQIAEEIKVPFWNKDGQSVIHQIEHRVDFQLIGNRADVIDNIKNLLLLDRQTNNQYGKNVKQDIRDHIQSIIDHYKVKFKGLPSARKAMADKDYEIYFDSFLYEKVAPLGIIVKEFLENPADPFNPISKKNIDVRKFEVTKGHFILKTSADRAGYLVPYKAKGVVIGGFRVTADGDEENHKLNLLKLEPASGKKVGKRTILEKDLTAINFNPESEVPKSEQDVYIVNNQALAVKLKDLIGVKGLSPVVIKSADIDSGFNLQVHGTVSHNVQFLKDNNVEVGFDINGTEVSVFAGISKDKITVFPKPFQITNSSLMLTAGTEGVEVDGDLGFEIKDLGKGNLSAIAGTTGFAVAGDFELENKKFRGSQITFKYLKNEWEIGGKILVPEPKLITGIKKADLTVDYKTKKITAKGSAELDVPAIDSVKLDAEFNDNGSFNIKGNVELKKLPGIKSGSKVDVEVSKLQGSEEYSLSITGQVEPDLPKVPNLNTKFTVSYKDGLFKAEGKADFNAKKGMISGELTVGVTNGNVVESKPPTEGNGKEITFYGNALLEFHPIESITSKIGVKINPKGEALFSAELDISAKPFEEVKPAPLEILKVSKDVLLAGVPFLSLNLRVSLDASLYATWEPLIIKIKGSIKDKTYDELIAGKLDAALNIEAETKATAGLKIGVGAGLTVTVAVLTGGAELKGNVALEAVGKLTGTINAKWSGDKGLKLTEAEAKASVDLNLIPSLDGRAFVDLDLLISKKTLWERNYGIAKGEPTNLYKLGITVPFKFDDNNKLMPLNLKQIEFNPALNKEKAKEQGENAVEPKGNNANIKNKDESGEDSIRQEVGRNLRNKKKNQSADMYAYASNLRTHMLKSTKPELKNIVLKAVEDELKAIELEDFTTFRADVLSSKEPISVKLNRIDDFEKEHGTISKDDLNILRNEVRSQGAPGPVMKKPQPGSEHSFAVPDDFADRIQRAEPNGLPLALDVKAEMNKQFGADFSKVRVHYDNESIALANEVNAQAFTHENHIFFNNGKYEPATSEGKKLLAHELTHVLQQGYGEPVKRVAEKDASGTRFTGNYIFNPGHDGLSSSFFNMVKRFTANGTLTDTEIRALRKDAIDRNGSVLHAELLLMAAMRNPVNIALMQAHRGGSLILSMSNILQADKDYVINFDRAQLPPELANPLLRLALAALGLSGETAAEAWEAMNRTAENRIEEIGGKQFADQAAKLIVSAGFSKPEIPLTEVLTAMVNSAADSTPGDQIMAGIVYVVARRYGHSTAPHILNGTIKVDALIPSVYKRLLGGGEASYVYSTEADVRKANTIYVPTSVDILALDERALIIHELTHAEDDLNRPAEELTDSLELESRAYVAQGRYMLDEIIAAAPAPGLVSTASAYVNLGNLYYWSMLLAAKRNTTRYEAIFLNVCTTAPASRNQANVKTDLALTETAISANIRAALLALRSPGGQQLYFPGNTRLGGSSGHYFQ